MSSYDSKGLESLQVWQKAMELAISVCKNLLPTLPVEEKYALTDQLRRSVQSIPSNIAEGFGRYYYQEGVRFCYIARGSLTETLSHLYLAKGMGYIAEGEYERYLKTIDEINRMLSGYIAFLRKSKRGAAEYTHSVHENPSDYITIDLEYPEEDLP